MTDCPMCMGEMRTESADGVVWAVCPNCDCRFVFSHEEEQDGPSEIVDTRTDRPIMIRREGCGGMPYKRDYGEAVLKACRDNCIAVKDLGEQFYKGTPCDAYEVDALADEWAQIIKGVQA